MVDANAALPTDLDTQLVQVRVPLDRATEVFSAYDPEGRVPIVVIPDRPFRIRFDLLLVAAGILAGALVLDLLLRPGPLLFWLLVVTAIGLAVTSIIPAIVVRVPEGANALLARRGRYWKSIGPGVHLLPPWIAITHLVTRRQVPFEIPAIASPTSDRVIATIQTVITFEITDPYRFVYSISASDFDLVLQASCQDAFRQLVHGITADEVMGLTRADTEPLRGALDMDIASFGVTISKVNITYARPPDDFMATEEARQLAVVKRAEQIQLQELALRRLADEEELQRQRVIALAERTREEVRQQIELATLRRSLIELEAENEGLRLTRMEERLSQNPAAAKLDWNRRQLEVARALAGNTRAVLQVGNAGDIGRVLMIHDLDDNAESGVGGDTGAQDGLAAVPAPVESE